MARDSVRSYSVGYYTGSKSACGFATKTLKQPDMSQTVTQWQSQAAVKDSMGRPLRDLRISVIDRCNYRCPYCMPAELYGDNHKFLPRAHWLTPGEIKRVASVFLQLGVKKFRLTGGEPLLRRDIVDIVAGIAELNGADDIAITTNGSRLADHATALKAAGLKRITVSLDSLDPEVFREMNGGARRAIAGARGYRRGARGRFPDQAEHGRRARQERSHAARSGRAFSPAPASSSSSSSSWTSAPSTAGSRSRSYRRRNCSSGCVSVGPFRPCAVTLAAKSRSAIAFDDGQGKRSASSRPSANRSAAIAIVRGFCTGAVYTCLFASSGRTARPAALRCEQRDLVGLFQNISATIERIATARSAAGCSSTSPKARRRPSESRCTGWAADADARRCC